MGLCFMRNIFRSGRYKNGVTVVEKTHKNFTSMGSLTCKNVSKCKEYVAVSIDICPRQIPMHLGIKLKVTPHDTPGCIR